MSNQSLEEVEALSPSDFINYLNSKKIALFLHDDHINAFARQEVASKNRKRKLPETEEAQINVSKKKQKDLSYEIVQEICKPFERISLIKELMEILMTPWPSLFLLKISYCNRDFSSIENALRYTISFGGEINLSSLINCIIQYPLKTLVMFTVSIARNISDNLFITTVKNLRPDFLVWLNRKILIFKGEDKRVPYIFAYAAVGNSLKFYAINQDWELRSVSRLFDLSIQKDRLFAIVITDTAHVANLIHTRDLNDRPSYPTLRGDRYRVILSPLGYCYEPQNESELKD
ncbi:14843_t:CDS:2, partial [Funneliformis geosporum]